MTAPREIQQIEYRWERHKDLVPVASSMSPSTTQSWDALIYSWVRHPETDVTSESVRYQVLPDGRAVLAWRYRDPRAAKRDDGTQGRPLVSRVFVAQPGLLTPDIAIVLCRAGLPGTAGRLPGETPADTMLPPVSIDGLRNLAIAKAETMDGEAIREPGLMQLLTAALTEPGLPLAIQLRVPYICDPLAASPQPSLLWGLWRIGRPLLGDAGRGWSFSTFEAPLGDSDPERLPDIVFRLDQPILHAPIRSRPERRVRPRDPSAPVTLRPYPEMPAWLVEEYQARGGEELGRLLAEWGAGAPLDVRFGAVYYRLRVSRRLAPLTLAPERAPTQHEHAEQDEHGSGQQEDHGFAQPGHLESRQPDQRESREPEQQVLEQPERHEPEEPDQHEPGEPERHQPEKPEQQVSAAQHDTRQEYTPTQHSEAGHSSVDTPTAPYQVTFPVDDNESLPSGYGQAAKGRPPEIGQPQHRGEVQADFPPAWIGSVQPLPPRDRTLGPAASQALESGPDASQAQAQDRQSPPSAPHRPATVTGLLSQLTTASDPQEFRSVLQHVHELAAQPEQGDRRQACYAMQSSNWYIPDLLRYGYVPCENELAAIFRIILLPDLELEQVQRQMARWILDAAPTEIRPLIRSLLLAPGDGDAGKQMRRLLRPALAARLIADYECLDVWPSAEPEPQESVPGGSSLRRFFRGSRD